MNKLKKEGLHYPKWVTQTGADKILHLTAGERAHLIIADLGYIENIVNIFQNRILYYMPFHTLSTETKHSDLKSNYAKKVNDFKDPHSTGVASISIGNIPLNSQTKEYKVYGLAKQAAVVSIANNYLGAFDNPPASMTTTIMRSLGIDSNKIHHNKNFKLTNIINLSMGHTNEGLLWLMNKIGGGTFAHLKDVKINQVKDDFLLVISAGNEESLLESDAVKPDWFENSKTVKDFFPALLREQNSTNVMLVGALSENDKGQLWHKSNYNNKLVDIAAPGGNLPIIRTSDQKIVFDSGTTYAAAIVSATAELILSCNNRLSGAEVKKILVEEADIVANLKNKVIDGKVLNIEKSVRKACLPDDSSYTYENLNRIMNLQQEELSSSPPSQKDEL